MEVSAIAVKGERESVEVVRGVVVSGRVVVAVPPAEVDTDVLVSAVVVAGVVVPEEVVADVVVSVRVVADVSPAVEGDSDDVVSATVVKGELA